MNRKYTAVSLVILTLLQVSCSRRVESGYQVIPLVQALVADSLQTLQRVAAEAGKPSGVIAIVGDPSRCLALSERMITCDDFDNVDARRISDGLPDFAGETIVPVLDFANFPYDSLSSREGSQMAFREIAVRGALAAIDSSIRCKVLILCSPQLSQKGGDDVADLFARIGCEVPVIYSSDTTTSLTDRCFLLMRERNLFTHNIAFPTARILMTIPDSVNPPFTTVTFDDDLVPGSFADTVGVIAPNTYVSYVQNQR